MTSAVECVQAIGSKLEIRLYDEDRPLPVSKSARAGKARHGIRINHDDLEELRSNFFLVKNRRAVSFRVFHRGQSSAAIHRADFDAREDSHGIEYTLTPAQAAAMPVPIQTHHAFGLKYGPSPLVQFVRCIESSALRWRIVRGGRDPLWTHEPVAMIEIIETSDPTLTDNDVEPPRQQMLDEHSYVTTDGRRLFKPVPYNDSHFQEHQYNRKLRVTNKHRADGTEHINVPTGAEDDPPLSVERYVGHSYVVRERIFPDEFYWMPSAPSSGIVYSPIPVDPVELSVVDYHERSEDSERTMKSDTVYFDSSHDHPVELGRCRLCKPLTIDRTFNKTLHEGDASHFTFAKPKRQDQMMASDLRNILIASEKNPLYTGYAARENGHLIPAQEHLNERIDTIETLRTTYEGGPPTAEQKTLLIENLKEKFYRGELDLPKAGAVFVMTFENQEVKLLAEQLGMTPNALSQYRAEVIHKIKNPARLDSEMASAQVLTKLTLAQLQQINEQGSIQVIRWTGGRNVQILELASQMAFRDGGEQFDGWRDFLFAPYSKPGPLHGYNVIDAICRLSREQAQYRAHVDNLPKRKRLVPGAWKTDLRARAVANRLWSRVAAFNFGAPGWYRRYMAGTEEQKLAFISSGYVPRFPAS